MSDLPAAPAPLYGLVLTGGHSRRMQRDKAQLSYRGRPQLERTMELLRAHVEQAWISVRADQRADPARAAFPQIVDTRADLGPVAGLLAAQASAPAAAWLVLACDLPLLDETTVATLLQRRDSMRPATAYRSSHDGLPEPLCAVYEPASAAALRDYVAGGGRCPRRFLGHCAALLLDQPNPHALDNINTPEEYRAVSTALEGAARP
ncbi:MAG: NTP transferase domain-containing protein [Proteobacteria bacterium]|nr:NTP transferase domain-containing protein [Pseudomonadota bacterium]